ncbi:hypothetical protein SPSIL_017470 [Sporomusa silvacetica DSM 10669]|uniref:N-acetyltransferase domain-containing protein n=1 Tax=Sporomusa silvacetica DSM 10669 TaxID=1123289 RepID=A0ABZ3IJF5_9FIRM|nr:GNAT family N-acetyltransferase [Sporomusa silvacetica]OZC18400.1 acetyltransferase (GNAT) family protein [Sporomusa silvacetica DSM 10669]
MEIKHKDWTIRRITAGDIVPAIDFIIPMLHEVYPSIPDVAVRWDLANMEEAYVISDNAVMFAAFEGRNGQVIGTVAIRPYDDRIEAVRGCYDVPVTAELSRCYVNNSLRRQGIAGRLVTAIQDYCRDYGYKTICLHTHRFLPGGFPFWLSQGYGIRNQSQDGLETVYMDKGLTL